MAVATEKSAKSVVTGEVRLTYAYLFSPRKEDDGEDGKYGVTILIPKTDKATLAKVNKAIEAAKVDGKARTWNGKVPPNLKVTLHDGDEEKDLDDNPEYKGMMYMSCGSKDKPGMVMRDMRPAQSGEIYSGCYARVAITAAPYSNSGNKGVTFYLNHVQFMRDGDRLDGRSAPEDVFAALDDEGDDEGVI